MKFIASLPFVDARIEKKHNQLITSVYHKSASEPYVVPFGSDHPRHMFGNVIQTALLRAVRYSSTTELFGHEMRDIRLMLLYNRYSTSYRVLLKIEVNALFLFLLF